MPCCANVSGDFTNGWPEGFFSKIFAEGETCDVGFSLENCPPLKEVMTDTSNCEYSGLIVDEVGHVLDFCLHPPPAISSWGFDDYQKMNIADAPSSHRRSATSPSPSSWATTPSLA